MIEKDTFLSNVIIIPRVIHSFSQYHNSIMKKMIQYNIMKVIHISHYNILGKSDTLPNITIINKITGAIKLFTIL